MMRLYTLACGDEIHRYKKSIVVPFEGKRRVLSTCPLNGGYRETLKAVVNNDDNPGAGIACTLKAPTYEEHMALIVEALGLDSKTTAAMSTAASMENAAIRTETFEQLSVTAVVTGGIEVNGGRVGDPASWNEVMGKTVLIKPGTINVMLFINTDLKEGTLARAMVTCTEAKTAAVQEMIAPSRYSMGIATGSGTDGTIVVCNAESDIVLTDAGKHSKLGELIGKAVKAAVKEALKKQSGLTPEKQHNMLRRMDRFGITEDSLWTLFEKNHLSAFRPEFEERLWKFATDGNTVVCSSLYAHLLDQLMWGMITAEEAFAAGNSVLGMMKHQHMLEADMPEEVDILESMIQLFQDSVCEMLSL